MGMGGGLLTSYRQDGWVLKFARLEKNVISKASMERKNGVFGAMDVKGGSMFFLCLLCLPLPFPLPPPPPSSLLLPTFFPPTNLLRRSPHQISTRLDRLIAKIRDLQRPYMNGEAGKAADIVVVRPSYIPPFHPTNSIRQFPSIPLHYLHPPTPLISRLLMIRKVAHGMSLRCFVKRWLGYPLDMPLALMLAPGGIGVLRYVILLSKVEVEMCKERKRGRATIQARCESACTYANKNSSYLKHDIEQPAFYVGMSIPGV